MSGGGEYIDALGRGTSLPMIPPSFAEPDTYVYIYITVLFSKFGVRAYTKCLA